MKTFFTIALLVLCVNAFAQKQGNVWCFGTNAGLNFNSGAPVCLTGIAINQDEGCASIADSSGNLLFYTDGIYIWDRDNNLMPNGYYLDGHSSATQSALIVKQPGSDSLYYVFTVDAFEGVKGFNYSVVDMNLHGGMGDVNAKKNVNILPTSDERLTAVRNANGKDLWIIITTSGADTVKAFQLTDTGFNKTPVITATGITPNGTYSYIGYLKPSLTGKKLALAVDDIGQFAVFDFDNATGIISNTVAITGINFEGAYGVEFSPDGSLLYGTLYDVGIIYQFNLAAGSQTAIINSAVKVGTSSSFYIGSLQLAPDGKIYMARYDSSYLGVINNPNVQGTQCNFVDDGFHLTTGSPQQGLPNIPYNIFNTNITSSVSSIKTNDLSIYPNPANDVITIKTSSAQHNTFYTITDITGRMILTGQLRNEINAIAINQLSGGVYLLQVGNELKQTFKVVKN